MTAVEDDDFEDGIRLMNRILAVRGQVVPVSPTPLTLHARLTDGTVVDGQSEIMRTPGIDRVWITPDDVRASDDALAAIAEAELIVLGPGSLYTSLLPSLLIPTIREAIERTIAPRIYVCNVATQEGETTGFDLAAHVEALAANAGASLVDIVLANNHVVAVRAARRMRRAARPAGRTIARTGQAALAAGGRPGPAPDPRRRRGPAGAAPPRSGQAGARDHPRARWRDRDPAPDDRPIGHPDRLGDPLRARPRHGAPGRAGRHRPVTGLRPGGRGRRARPGSDRT